MFAPFFIARRYFLSKKKQNFINIISGFSVLGVMLGTMSLIVVLSVFNGLEDLIRNIYGTFDPHLKITPALGKSFVLDQNKLAEIRRLDHVLNVTEVIEDNALVKYNEQQTIIKMKGVSGNFADQHELSKYLLEGVANFNDNGVQSAIIGRGVQYKLGIDMQNRFYQLQFFYPKSGKKIQLNPEKAFNSENLFPGGVFALEKQYDDNYVFVPLAFAASLMEYGQKRTSLEINLDRRSNAAIVKEKLLSLLGPSYTVRTIEEQHVSMLRAIKIEKLFVYVTFSFILLVSSLNIFFMLTMLAIEKKTDMAILHAMGAPGAFIKKIFLFEGLIIGVIGAMVGIALGFGICYIQQTFGIISMGTETSLVNTYPVKMKLTDFIITGLIILGVTLLISYQPAKRASQIEVQAI